MRRWPILSGLLVLTIALASPATAQTHWVATLVGGNESPAVSSAATTTSQTPRPRSTAPLALHSRAAARPAPVAQLDRASVYGTEGQRFESSRAHHGCIRAKYPA